MAGTGSKTPVIFSVCFPSREKSQPRGSRSLVANWIAFLFKQSYGSNPRQISSEFVKKLFVSNPRQVRSITSKFEREYAYER